MEETTFLIDSYDIEFAKKICNSIEDNDERNKAVANVLAVKLADKAFVDNLFDTTSGLYNVQSTLKDYEIFDIYIDNKYIDVRLCFNEDELIVPKKHFINDLLPYAYMFIKVAEDLSEGTLLGFALPENIEKSEISDYFKVNKSDLISYEKLNAILTSVELNSNIDDLHNVESLLFDYIDGKLTKEVEIALISFLLKNQDLRKKFVKYANVQDIIQQAFPSQKKLTSDIVENIIEDYDFSLHEESISKDFDSDISDNIAVNVENDDVISEIYSGSNVQEFSNIDLNTEEFSDDSEVYINKLESTVDIIGSEQNASGYSNVISEEYTEVIPQNGVQNNNYANQIDEIYSNTEIPSESQEFLNDEFVKPVKLQKNKFLLLLGILAILSTAGFYTYNNLNTEKDIAPALEKVQQPFENLESKQETQKEEALVMPNETIENVNKEPVLDESTPITIPEIESNLGSSIAVSNLTVSWEVPSSYSSSTAAQNYLIKIGKIIRLNLKTELLLLDKQAISNKIMLELEFNKKLNKFDLKGITASSGEKLVDDLISKTVKNALDLGIKTNMKVFVDMPGNPVLIIRL